jgi:DNA replication protein DnaC
MQWLEQRQQYFKDHPEEAEKLQSRAEEIGNYRLAKDKNGYEYAVPINVDTAKAEYFLAMLDRGQLPPVKLTTDKLNPVQMEVFKALTDKKLQSALLFGPTGTGKTTVAAMALRHWYIGGTEVLAMTMRHLKTHFEPASMDRDRQNHDDLVRFFRKQEVLLIDDLGAGQSGDLTRDHEREVLMAVVNARESSGRYTWITSNYHLRDLLKRYGEPIISRVIRKGQSYVKEMPGANLRLELDGNG